MARMAAGSGTAAAVVGALNRPPRPVRSDGVRRVPRPSAPSIAAPSPVSSVISRRLAARRRAFVFASWSTRARLVLAIAAGRVALSPLVVKVSAQFSQHDTDLHS